MIIKNLEISCKCKSKHTIQPVLMPVIDYRRRLYSTINAPKQFSFQSSCTNCQVNSIIDITYLPYNEKLIYNHRLIRNVNEPIFTKTGINIDELNSFRALVPDMSLLFRCDCGKKHAYDVTWLVLFEEHNKKKHQLDCSCGKTYEFSAEYNGFDWLEITIQKALKVLKIVK